MLLRHLLQALPAAQVNGSLALEIGDLACNSRQVTPGALFVAVPSVGGDARSGGYHYLGEAVGRGAVAAVVQAGDAVEGVTTILVPDARMALAELAAAFFEHPSERLQLYAVTGTDGKTTTTYLLEQIFASAGYRTGLIGTVETKSADRRERNLDRMTTPESLDLQRLLRQMVDAGVTHVAIEASSHGLALQRLRGCRFAACALTNITSDHVEFHGCWDAYFAAKASLFTAFGRGRPAVLNADDEHCDRLAAMVAGPVLTYGFQSRAQIRAINVRTGAGETRCTVCTGEEEAEVRVPLPGLFNVSNALAAIGLALTAGLGLETIASGLEGAQPPPGRMQHVAEGQQFDVLIDYAHTVRAFESVLASLRAHVTSPHRLIAVFGAAGDRDRAKRPLLARIARQYADFFIITNEDPFGEQPRSIMQEIAVGAPKDEEGSRFRLEEDRGRAIELALAEARPGDTVVILGKGHEQSIVVNGHKKPWSDFHAVRRALEGLT
jgi:UDP-N-acetylmuramoyl-L-alanyl-D-glutamate--2,6-diaminopimelate ligase